MNMKRNLLIAISLALASFGAVSAEHDSLKLEKSDLQRPYFSPEGYVFYKNLAKQTPVVAGVVHESAIALSAKCGRSPTLEDMKAIINNNAMFLKAVAIRTIAANGKGEEPEKLFGDYATAVSSISCTYLADATQ